MYAVWSSSILLHVMSGLELKGRIWISLCVKKYSSGQPKSPCLTIKEFKRTKYSKMMCGDFWKNDITIKCLFVTKYDHFLEFLKRSVSLFVTFYHFELSAGGKKQDVGRTWNLLEVVLGDWGPGPELWGPNRRDPYRRFAETGWRFGPWSPNCRFAIQNSYRDKSI